MNIRLFIAVTPDAAQMANALISKLKLTLELGACHEEFFNQKRETEESFMHNIGDYDFAIFVLKEDGEINSDNPNDYTPRNNVVSMIRLFNDLLGNERIFCLYNERNLPILPSNCSKMMPITFNETNDFEDTLEDPVNQIKKVISELGLKEPKKQIPNHIKGISSKPPNVPRVYWAAPHHEYARNQNIKEELEKYGIVVNMPGDLVKKASMEWELDSQENNQKFKNEMIRSICIDALKNSSFVVVDLDKYGLDSSWEIGFAETKGMPIIGYSVDNGLIIDARKVNRKSYSQNVMHGWDSKEQFDNIDDMVSICKGKKVYICGSFRNENAMNLLRESKIKKYSKKLTIPRDEYKKNSLPKEYSWAARERTINQLKGSEIVLVILPKYGMDSSWQIGYADQMNKKVIGWKTNTLGPSSEEAPLWDHWMNNWKEKITVTNADDLVSVIMGLHYFKKSSFSNKIN